VGGKKEENLVRGKDVNGKNNTFSGLIEFQKFPQTKKDFNK